MAATFGLDRTLSEVQKKIYGTRTQELTPAEVYRMFGLPIDPEFNLILYRALERRAISPDVAILQAIPRAVTNPYLMSIALCLRFGANPNMYVNAPKLGTIHILGYIYYVLGGDRFSSAEGADSAVLNTIVLMFIIKGSRPSLPVFDRNAGRIRSEMDTVAESISVTQWVTDQGYPHILDKITSGDPRELQKSVDSESLVQLAIYLDMPEISPRLFQASDQINAIRAHCHNVFDQIPVLNTVVGMDYETLEEAVTDLNATAYTALLSKGQSPSYLLLNRLLLDMQYFKTRGGIIALKELEYMLVQSVTTGSQLDLDQRTILATLGPDILEVVTKSYAVPYWLKVCKSSATRTPAELKHLAAALNLDPSMSTAALCRDISAMAKADKEALKEAAKRRQQLRMVADLGTMNEFLNGKTPNLTCRNRSSFTHDPLEYNDVDIAYYRDDQGAVWCFPSDRFSALLETGVNPYNQTALPDSFLAQVRYQITILEVLGIQATEVGVAVAKVPATFISAIDSLTSPDTMNEKTSAHSVQEFLSRGSVNGVALQTLRGATKDQMMAALRTIKYEVNIAPLTTSHALVTTARIVNHVAHTEPSAVKTFFQALSAEPLL